MVHWSHVKPWNSHTVDRSEHVFCDSALRTSSHSFLSILVHRFLDQVNFGSPGIGPTHWAESNQRWNDMSSMHEYVKCIVDYFHKHTDIAWLSEPKAVEAHTPPVWSPLQACFQLLHIQRRTKTADVWQGAPNPWQRRRKKGVESLDGQERTTRCVNWHLDQERRLLDCGSSKGSHRKGYFPVSS